MRAGRHRLRSTTRTWTARTCGRGAAEELEPHRVTRSPALATARRTAGEVAARVEAGQRVGRIAHLRQLHLAHVGVGDQDVVLADAESPAAVRTERHREAAGEAGDARRFRDAIAIVVAAALRGTQAAVGSLRRTAGRQLTVRWLAQAGPRFAIGRRRRQDHLVRRRLRRAEIADPTNRIAARAACAKRCDRHQDHEHGVMASHHRER